MVLLSWPWVRYPMHFSIKVLIDWLDAGMLLQEYAIGMAGSEAPVEWLRGMGDEDDCGGADASLEDVVSRISEASRKKEWYRACNS